MISLSFPFQRLVILQATSRRESSQREVRPPRSFIFSDSVMIVSWRRTWFVIHARVQFTWCFSTLDIGIFYQEKSRYVVYCNDLLPWCSAHSFRSFDVYSPFEQTHHNRVQLIIFIQGDSQVSHCWTASENSNTQVHKCTGKHSISSFVTLFIWLDKSYYCCSHLISSTELRVTWLSL